MDHTEKIAIAIVIAFIILLTAPVVYFEKTKCKVKAEKMGFECDWGFVQDCMIKVKGNWIPMKSYKVIE